MNKGDWFRVIDEASALGVRTVQFIGGEPTLHPDLPDLVGHALDRGIVVEVFTNLVHIDKRLWRIFSAPGVRLATSYYSADADLHDSITMRAGSHRKTLANIREAVSRKIPLRVGVVGVRDGQGIDAAVLELTSLGIVDLGVDYLRQVGRGVRDQRQGVDQLCGKCAEKTLAVSPSGDVWPCVLSRWMCLGNVQDARLEDIHYGPVAAAVRAALGATFARRGGLETAGGWDCGPRCNPNCHPNCNPRTCEPVCSPRCSPTCNPISCQPRECWPSFEDSVGLTVRRSGDDARSAADSPETTA